MTDEDRDEARASCRRGATPEEQIRRLLDTAEVLTRRIMRIQHIPAGGPGRGIPRLYAVRYELSRRLKRTTREALWISSDAPRLSHRFSEGMDQIRGHIDGLWQEGQRTTRQNFLNGLDQIQASIVGLRDENAPRE